MKPPEFKILTQNEVNEIEKTLFDQFGIKKINGIVLQRGAERLFIYQGSLNETQIKKLEQEIPIERIGIYFAKFQNNELRLSIEGTQIFKNQITKNIFEINDEQKEIWMHGSELNIATGEKTFLIIKYQSDFLGCGKASLEKITNFIPKNRRLKFKEQKQ